MILTEHQQERFNEIIHSSQRISILSGPGGVGKSVVSSELIQHYTSLGKIVGVTSSTHKGVAVISDLISEGMDPSFIGTIHSFLYLKLTYSRYETKLTQTTSEPRHVDVLFIDEYSMLTNEIITYLEAHPATKIILVGDHCQLIMDRAIMTLPYHMVHLIEPQRQDPNSELYKYLTTLRNYISGDTSLNLDLPSHPDIEIFEDHGAFLRAYTRTNGDKIIVCFHNKVVRSYNQNIRKYHLNNDDTYSVDDYVILTQPVGTAFKNRERVQLTSVSDYGNYFTVTAKNSKGIQAKFDIPATKSFLDAQLLKCKEQSDWSNYYRLKESMIMVHHEYAGTAHSYQGDTTDFSFIDLSDILTASDNDTIVRLMYVALSRARKKVFIFRGDKRSYSKLKG